MSPKHPVGQKVLTIQSEEKLPLSCVPLFSLLSMDEDLFFPSVPGVFATWEKSDLLQVYLQHKTDCRGDQKAVKKTKTDVLSTSPSWKQNMCYFLNISERPNQRAWKALFPCVAHVIFWLRIVKKGRNWHKLRNSGAIIQSALTVQTVRWPLVRDNAYLAFRPTYHDFSLRASLHY